MNIYTSYWAMIRNFPTNLIGLNTTIWPPKWRPLGKDKRGVWVIDCPPLKPGPACSGLCHGPAECPSHPASCDFLYTYYQQLKNIDMNKFYNNLKRLNEEISKNEEISDINFALIVYEAPTNKCSERWPLQAWLRENNIEVKEWSK